MTRLLLDRDTIVLTPQRSRSHLSDLVHLGVAHGFDQIHGHDHVVPASVWRFDREVDLDEEAHLSGESLVRPDFQLAPGITSVTAHCRLPGFISVESCYPAPQGQPVTHFRHRFLALLVSTEGDVLRLSIKPRFMPEQIVFTSTVTEVAAWQTVTLEAEEWTTFLVHRFDQVITSFDASNQRASDTRFQRVRRGIV